MTKSDIIKNNLRRYCHLPIRTIARTILATDGDKWDGDLDKIRDAVRYRMGKMGNYNRNHIPDTSLFRVADVPLPQTWRRKISDFHLPPGSYLVLSDVHVPFHEMKPLEAAVQAGQAEKVDAIFINGDFQDCASVSFWPTAHRDFNREVEAVIDTFDWLRHEFPDAKIYYKGGNHEYRLPRLFVSKMPELAETPLSAMETVIGFEERGIEFLDYNQKVYAGLLPIVHGHEFGWLSRAVNPARGLFLRAKSFAACSHCHTTSEHTARDINDMIITCWSFGCLCDLSPDYNPLGNDWNWGFGLLNVEKDKNFEVINRRILPNGKVV